jgi:hypothetical protein
MLADGILQTATGTGVAGANLSLSAVTLGGLALPTFASKFTAGSLGDAILFGVRRKDNPVLSFVAIGHLSDASTLVIDKLLTTWDGGALDDTSPASIALANGVDYYVYPTMEAGAMLGAWPTVTGDLTASTDSKRVMLSSSLAGGINGSNFSMTANTLYQWPARWQCMDSLKRLGAAVAGVVAGSNFRLGVWAMTAAGGRGRLIADSGNLSGAAATYVSATNLLGEIRPPAHGVWVGAMADAAVALRGSAVTGDPGVMGWAPTGFVTNAYGYSTRTFTSGLPDPLPAPTTLFQSSTGFHPAVWGGV